MDTSKVGFGTQYETPNKEASNGTMQIENDNIYKGLYDSIKEGFARTSMTGEILESNRTLNQMLGYTPEELKKLTYKELTPKKWHHLDSKMVSEQVTKRGYSDEYEKECIKKDGTVFPVAIRVWLIRDENGRAAGMWALIRDISEKKKTENELLVSLAKYRLLFETLPLGITLADKDGKPVESNSAGIRLLGVSKDELYSTSLNDIQWQSIRPDGSPMPPEEHASVRALKEQRLVQNVEMGLVKAKRNVTWINVSASPIPVEGYGVLIVYSDITERMAAQQKIRSLSSFPEYSPSGVVEVDFNGRFTYTNPAFNRLVNDLGIRNSKALLPANIAEIIKENQEKECNFALEVCVNGHTYSEIVHVIPKFKAVRIYMSNITEIKKAENELKESKKVLLDSNRQLEEKNITMHQLMERLAADKKELEDKVMTNVDRFIMPLVEKLGSSSEENSRIQVEILRNNLQNLTSAFGQRLSAVMNRLTPKEIEICNHIRNGMSSKDIAKMLDISARTIDAHRDNIRKKLGVKKKKINLTTYLASIKE